jgi:hypothetical protein
VILILVFIGVDCYFIGAAAVVAAEFLLIFDVYLIK